MTILTDYLNELGFAVVKAIGGQNAYTQAKQTQPDLILLDITVSDINSLQICRYLTTDSETKDIPVIVMAGHLEAAMKPKIFESGAVDYVMKPFQQADLIACLKPHLTIRKLKKDLQEKEIYLQQEISQRKQAETAFKKAKQTADMANRAKNIFLDHMSHELRTPLNGILGYTQILKQDKSLTDKQSEAIDIIHRSGRNLLIMINDILNLSKIETGEMKLSPNPFHLLEFLDVIVEIMQIRAQQKEISFVYKVLSPLPTAIYSDETRLREILINLLGNAIKFTTEGTVTFSVRSDIQEMEEAEELPVHKIGFQIEDTGIGIPSQQIEDVFLPFYQIGDKRIQEPGTGLGLAISRELVQMMRGQLQVQSVEGKGSTFWFTVNVSEAAWDAKLTKIDKLNVAGYVSRITKGNQSLKALIVDDQQENRIVLRELFEALKFEIEEATDGYDALRQLETFEPDLILVDLVMPEMDGYELTRQIRQIDALDDSIIIATSANVFEETRLQSLTAGCDDFISKPFQISEILAKLQQHLQLEWLQDNYGDGPPLVFDGSQGFIVPPPLAELATLHELVIIGDVSALQQQADKLRALDASYIPFANKIYQLADKFLLDKLQEFIEQHLEKAK